MEKNNQITTEDFQNCKNKTKKANRKEQTIIYKSAANPRLNIKVKYLHVGITDGVPVGK